MQENEKRELPKNFRQIGDPGAKKIYMEDYVYTYLSKLSKPGNIYARGAILFGKVHRTEVGECLFISGACACQNLEFDLDKTCFDEEAWNNIYNIRNKYFVQLDVVGWFLSRMGFSTELNDKIIRIHMDSFGGRNKVLYMIDALEDEDAFYQLENYALKKQRGYYIYYETNDPMKNYMLEEGKILPGEKNITLKRDSRVVKDYKKALKEKKSVIKKQTRRLKPVYVTGTLTVLAVLLFGIQSIYQFRKNQSISEVFHQENNIASEEVSTIAQDAVETAEEDETSSIEPMTNNDMEGTTYNADDSVAQTDETNNTGTDINDTDTNGTSTDGTGVDGTNTDGTSTAATGTDDVGTQNTENGYNSDGTYKNGSSKPSTESQNQEKDVFTQEDPDDSWETWNYIGGYYTVKEGDTLAGISKKIYQSYDYVNAIALANDIINVDNIYPGQILEMPEIEE